MARALFLCFFFVFCLFLVGSKSDVSAFFRLRFRNGLGTKPAGALPFRMRSRRSFLRLCLVAEVSLCLVAEVSQWLGHDSIVFRGSKSNVSRFLRLQFRNGLDAKPAGSHYHGIWEFHWCLVVSYSTSTSLTTLGQIRKFTHTSFLASSNWDSFEVFGFYR